MPPINVAELQFFNVPGRRSLLTLFHFEAHPVTFSKALKSGHVDSGVVNEHVATLVLLNEAKTLLVVEPLHSTVYHSADLL
jgi:hypothetical protein